MVQRTAKVTPPSLTEEERRRRRQANAEHIEIGNPEETIPFPEVEAIDLPSTRTFGVSGSLAEAEARRTGLAPSTTAEEGREPTETFGQRARIRGTQIVAAETFGTEPKIPGTDFTVEDIQESTGALFPGAEGFGGLSVGEVIFETARDDPRLFIQTLVEMGRSDDADVLLKTFFELDDAEIAELYEPTQLEILIPQIFPNTSVDEFIDLLTNNRQLFFDRLQKGGQTKAKGDLLLLMGFTWPEINDIFKTKKLTLEIEGVRRVVTIERDNTVLDEQGREIGFYNTKTLQFEPGRYKLGDTWKFFTAGTGDLIATAGGATKWLGAEGIGKKLGEFGGFLQAQAPPDTLGEFKWSHLYNPRFYATTVVRTLPFTLSLVPAMVLGSAGAAAGAVGLGIRLGAYSNVIVRSLGASAIARPMEAALEAGGTYDEALGKGMTIQEAREAADKVFLNNLKLAGVDAAQLAIAFAPSPSRILGKLASRGLVRTATVGGKLVFTGVTEGGEEAYQEIIQRMALGEKIEWDAEMKLSVSIGSMMGISMGAGGDVFIRITNRTKDAMTPEQKAAYNEALKDFVAQVEDPLVADTLALDVVAEQFPDLEQSVEAIVEEAKIDEYEKEIKPKDEVDKIVWENTFEKMREEIAPTAGIELTERERAELVEALETPVEAVEAAVPEAVPEAPAVSEEAVVPAPGEAISPEVPVAPEITAEQEARAALEIAEEIRRTTSEPDLLIEADEVVKAAQRDLDVAVAAGEAAPAVAEAPEVAPAPKAAPKPKPKPAPKVAPEVDVQAAKQAAFIVSNEAQEPTTQADEDAGKVPKGDISKAGEDSFNAESAAAGLPPPNIPPGSTGHIGAGGQNPENALYDMVNNIIPGEDSARAAERVWAGRRKRLATQTIVRWRKGNKILKDQGVGETVGRTQRLTKEDSFGLFQALHGEGKVPAKFQDVFNDLKTILDKEASDMFIFDPEFSRVMMAHPDYFPRGWKPPRNLGKQKLGAKPGFLKPRVDATFTEMVDAGWEPVSWNPYDMVALRVMAGNEYREGQKLIDTLKMFSKAINERDAPRKGWRVPRVGPAFEGKPYVAADGAAHITPKIAVPDSVADVLESTYGAPVEFRVAGVDIFKAVTAFGAVTKRAKLFASLFQHVDFLTRGAIVANTPEGIRHGAPARFPSMAARISASAFSESIRGNLETRILSGDSLYKDFEISLRDVADAGWELGVDESLIKRSVSEELENIVKEAQEEGLEVSNFRKATAKITKATDPVTRRLDSAAKFFETGLFEGVYRESQAFALEHVIIPRIRRSHPDWTKEQIAGSAAVEVNKQFSTLPVWQSVLQQPAVRAVGRAFFFSFNESESLLKQAASTIKGPNATYWREFSLSTIYTLIIAANVINLISEGDPLPEDRYVPVQFGSPYSSLPGGVAYSDKFLSPRLPWNGRGGQPIYLDLMGQLDTWMRWILDPAGAFTSRVNVLPRAVMNQIQGKDFWGRELTDLPDRARQAAMDLFAPIGAGNLVEVARTQFPPIKEIVPEAEGRIGNIGSLIQATGLNVRAIKTRDLLDQFARDANLVKADGSPVKSWSDLERNQRQELEKNKTLQTELGLRGDAAVERNYPGAKGFAELDRLDQERLVRGESLVGELVTELLNKDRTEAFGLARTFRDEVSRLKRDIASRKSQVNRDFNLFEDTGELPDNPNDRALVEYYNIFEKAKRPSGVIDWEKVNALEAGLREGWTPEQAGFVDRETGITEWGPLMGEFNKDQKTLSDSGWYDVAARDRKVFRFENPEVDKVLTGKFYNQKPIEGEAARIKLEWDDVYRQLDDAKDAFDLMTDKNLNALPPLEGFSQEEWDELRPEEKKRIMLEFDLEGTYRENPGFWEADKTRDAHNRGFGENLIPLYLQREAIARNTSHNSAEAIIFMHDNPELLEAGIKLDQWEGPDDPNISVLRLTAKWRAVDDAYDRVDKDDAAAVQTFRDKHPEWVDDNRRKEAFGWDRDIKRGLVEAYVKQGNIQDEFSPNSAEAMLARFDDNSGLEKFRTDTKNIDKNFFRKPVDAKRIPIWRIDVAHREDDEKYDSLKTTEERKAFLLDVKGNPTTYARKRRERDAYGLGLSPVGIEGLKEAAKEFMIVVRPPADLTYTIPVDGVPTVFKGKDLHEIFADLGIDVEWNRTWTNNYKKMASALDAIIGGRLPRAQIVEALHIIQLDIALDTGARNTAIADGDMQLTQFYDKVLEGFREVENIYIQALTTGVFEDYVDYKLLPTKGFRGERFLRENRDLYRLLLDKKVMGNKAITAIDFSGIPNVKFDEISEKWEEQFDKFNAIPGKHRLVVDEDKRDELIKRDRDAMFDANPKFEEAFYRRDGYRLLLDREGLDLITNHVTFRTFDRKGMEQELFLKEHEKYWAARGRIENPDFPGDWYADLRDDPIESLRISVKWQDDFDHHSSFGERGTEFYEPDPDVREIARKQFLLANPKFARARRVQEAWERDVPEPFIENFADYALIIEKGKAPEDSLFFTDDRYLMEHPNYYRDVWLKLLGRDPKDFSKVPSKEFEDFFNKHYLLDVPDNERSAARKANKKLRLANPLFDAEGVRVGIWAERAKPAAPVGGRRRTRGLR